MKKYLLLLLISGCAAPLTPQQKSEIIVQKFSPYCEGMGYQRNTDPWRGCIMKMLELYQREQMGNRVTRCYEGLGGIECR